MGRETSRRGGYARAACGERPRSVRIVQAQIFSCRVRRAVTTRSYPYRSCARPLVRKIDKHYNALGSVFGNILWEGGVIWTFSFSNL